MGVSAGWAGTVSDGRLGGAGAGPPGELAGGGGGGAHATRRNAVKANAYCESLMRASVASVAAITTRVSSNTFDRGVLRSSRGFPPFVRVHTPTSQCQMVRYVTNVTGGGRIAGTVNGR